MNNMTLTSKQTQTSAWNDLLWPVYLRSTRIFTDAGASASSQGRSIIYEVACEPADNCNVDQKSFKAHLARAFRDFQSLTASSNSTYNGTSSSAAYSRANSILQVSAQGAAAQCSGGDGGTTCGLDWTSKKWDGTQGIGQDLDALEVILANLPAAALNKANSTVTRTNSTGTVAEGGNGTESGSASNPSSTTNAAAGVWASSALVALFSATFISVLRLSM